MVGLLFNQATMAPSSALPLGTDRKARETMMVKVAPGDALLHSVIANTHADAAALPTDEVEAAGLLLASPVAGFYHVSEVDEEKTLLTVLAPSSARLVGKVCIMASLKWVESA